MTRDEASLKLQKELGWTRTRADLHVSGSACLGMLKLDEPKSAAAKLWEIYTTGISASADDLMREIEEAGLRIIEK